MSKTKKLTLLGILTALYVVLSFCMKFTVIGNIQIDLGYIVFAIALCYFGSVGFIVGAFGCAIESILLSAYGFSPSWFVANIVIGLGCGFVYKKTKKFWIRALFTVLFVLIGVGIYKTAIECILYNIPWEVKIVKNLVATTIDSVAMIIGLLLYPAIQKGCCKWKN